MLRRLLLQKLSYRVLNRIYCILLCMILIYYMNIIINTVTCWYLITNYNWELFKLLSLEHLSLMSNLDWDFLLLSKPTSSSLSLAPRLKIFHTTLSYIVVIELLSDPIIPLGKWLLHGNMSDVDSSKGLNVRTALEHRGKTYSTETFTMEETICGWRPVVGTGGLRMGEDYFL